MSYVSFSYFVLIAGIFLCYRILPLNRRWIALLAGNIIFYAQAGWREFALLILGSVVSWETARRMEQTGRELKELPGGADPGCRDRRKKLQGKKRRQLQFGLVLLIGCLAVTKYTNFLLKLGFRAAGAASAPMLKLVIPLGISFYTFQMLAYLVDVYKGKIPAQQNFAKYFLYASFFPTVVQGPIARYRQLGNQLTEGHRFRFEDLRDGCVQILWGLAKKLVMAERLSVFVASVFDDYRDYHGLIFLLAAAVYSVQMYADFSGCMDIAGGTARLFGIELAPNFLRPYFSKTMPEFWRRWHISLGSWFRDYVFFPFSISRLSQKINRKARAGFGEKTGRIVSAALPILLVWVLTGIWHGAELKYMVWGCYHGMLILLGTVFGPSLKSLGAKLPISTEKKMFQGFRMFRTFFLCCIGRVFFRAGSVRAALVILVRMFRGAGLRYIAGGALAGYGLNVKNLVAVVVFFLVWFLISVLQERGVNVLQKIGLLPLPLRWGLYYALLIGVLVFGKYGPSYSVSDFIYEQF